MKSIKIYFVSLGFLMATNSFSQIGNITDIGGKPLMASKYSKIEGSPYYFGTNTWMDGVLYTADGKKVDGVRLRYNAFEDEVEYRVNSNVLIIDNYNLSGFDFFYQPEDGTNRELYQFRNGYSIPGEIEKTDFFKVIYSGTNFSLLEELKMIETKVTPATYGASEYTKFVKDESTFLIIDGQVRKFKNRKSDYYEIAPEKKDEIKRLVKENYNRFASDQEIRDLLKEIDSKIL
ncbi:hypothetical protein C9994_01730 [Marivirga lumbricoides]|uniref:Uncharacterized protein n=1 Tax=Marivirga lumbricoides TaxID=1046115 RepID=A0A2T4DV61_9BACT|nr:hypothetical protein C9994_01730 [Marivirga lumbricoides]